MRVVKQFRQRHQLQSGLADLVHTYFDDGNGGGGGEYIEDTQTGQWWWSGADGSYYHGDQTYWEGNDPSGKFYWGYVNQGLPSDVPKPKPKATNWTPYLLIGGAAVFALAMMKRK